MDSSASTTRVVAWHRSIVMPTASACAASRLTGDITRRPIYERGPAAPPRPAVLYFDWKRGQSVRRLQRYLLSRHGLSDPEHSTAFSEVTRMTETWRVLPSLLTAAMVLTAPMGLKAQTTSADERRLTGLLGRSLSAGAFDENGWTDLHYAAAVNLPTAIEDLLNQEVFVDSILHVDGLPVADSVAQVLRQLGHDFTGWRNHGQSPLHVAAHANSRDAATTLLEWGANVDMHGELRGTPLHAAAARGYVELVRTLASYGADIDAPTATGHTSLHLAVRGGYMDVVRELNSRGADVHARNDEGRTPLHFAVRADDITAVRELAGRGADINAHASLCVLPPGQAVDSPGGRCTPARATSGDGRTPLQEAAAAGNVPIILELVRLGADVRLQDANRATAVHHAARGGHLDAIRELTARGAEVTWQDADGATPLHYAAGSGHMAVILDLLDRGADARRLTANGATAVHYAARGGHLEVVQELASRGTNVTLPDRDGANAVHYAARGGHVDVIQELARLGVDVRERDNKDATTVHYAASGGHVDAIRYLASRRVDLRRRTEHGASAAHYAALGGHVDAIAALATGGADLGRRDDDDETTLHYAAWGGHLPAIRDLMNRGVDLRRRDDDNETALHYVAADGHISAVRELLDNGADLRQRTSDSEETALHYAAWGGHIATIRELLNRGANVNVEADYGPTRLTFAGDLGDRDEAAIRQYLDVDGPTPLHHAAFGGRVDAIRELIDRGAAVNACVKDGGFGWTQALAAVATAGLVGTGIDSLQEGNTAAAVAALGAAPVTATVALTPDQAEGLRGTALDYAMYAGRTEAAVLLRALGGKLLAEIPDCQ